MRKDEKRTAFSRKVVEAIRKIPRGRVATYGQIAALAGNSRAARGVAWILHSSSDAERLPWHRVIGSRGRISLGRGRGFEKQRRRLAAEGIAVDRAGRIDLEVFQWEPRGKLPAVFKTFERSFR
ncbi:MAG: methylated-DNA--[protein]-cysteine S-methyltransferase [Candidatus Aminicenantes bacterium]|nr:methylated-DNA--[protein]-cysteine S-methyltransferase [Candidatus Aminicenantes bacterium]